MKQTPTERFLNLRPVQREALFKFVEDCLSDQLAHTIGNQEATEQVLQDMIDVGVYVITDPDHSATIERLQQNSIFWQNKGYCLANGLNEEKEKVAAETAITAYKCAVNSLYTVPALKENIKRILETIY